MVTIKKQYKTWVLRRPVIEFGKFKVIFGKFNCSFYKQAYKIYVKINDKWFYMSYYYAWQFNDGECFDFEKFSSQCDYEFEKYERKENTELTFSVHDKFRTYSPFKTCK